MYTLFSAGSWGSRPWWGLGYPQFSPPPLAAASGTKTCALSYERTSLFLIREEQMKRIDCKPGIDRDDYCSIESALDVIGGKWSFLVLHELFEGTRRFGELKRCISEV